MCLRREHGIPDHLQLQQLCPCRIIQNVSIDLLKKRIWVVRVLELPSLNKRVALGTVVYNVVIAIITTQFQRYDVGLLEVGFCTASPAGLF